MKLTKEVVEDLKKKNSIPLGDAGTLTVHYTREYSYKDGHKVRSEFKPFFVFLPSKKILELLAS